MDKNAEAGHPSNAFSIIKICHTVFDQLEKVMFICKKKLGTRQVLKESTLPLVLQRNTTDKVNDCVSI